MTTTTPTETATVTVNRNPLRIAGQIEQPDQHEVKATPTLWNASLEDAVRYGGDLTRAALGAMRLQGDKRFTIVDTKVHMLAPGQYPALPGWHTDGTPRVLPEWEFREQDYLELGRNAVPYVHPQYKGLPVFAAQEVMDSPRFHLLVTGMGCLTQFIDGPFEVDVPAKPSRNLYRDITRQTRERVEAGELRAFDMPTCTSVEWDWWTLHQAQAAKEVEWRFLIRVTESDQNEPQTDLRAIIRTQNQVFSPIDAGW
jgi:hypothetical protein